MIAALQRVILALWCLAVVLMVGQLARSESPPSWWATGLVLLFAGHAAVLGVEMAWMRLVHGRDATPRPTLGQILRAWVIECWHAPLVFFWRQPLNHARWPDLLPSTGSRQRGVLLVHGYVCNRGLWNAWLRRLHALRVPVVAVTLEPPFGDIDAYRSTIKQAVDALTQRTGMAPLVVAHSMGGLAVRAWWVDQPPEALHHLITLGSPHQGTRLARLGFSPNARQMREDSRWLQALAARETQAQCARTTCVHSHCDNIVFPPSNALLNGAKAVHLPATPHVAMVDHPAAWGLALAHLRD